MWYFTEIADWWERNRKETDTILDQWVENSSYNTGVMLVASTTKSFTAFGAGFVDILKLGDGVKKGTLKGFGIDALRVIAIFPFGKTAKTVTSFKGLSRAKVLVDTGGPNCFWIASAKAFAQIGHKYKGRLFATVEDVANALGMRIPILWEIPNLSKGISYLQRIGAKTGAIKKVTTTKELISRIPHDGSILMIVVDVMKDSKIIGGHAIYAYRTMFGQVRFMDRTVGKAYPNAYKSIAEIVPRYPGVTNFVPYEAAVIHNVFVKPIVHDTPRLVIPILGVIATEDN